MGVLEKQKPVKLIVSMIFKDEAPLMRAEKILKKIYGDMEPLEKYLPFDLTNYYFEEFGKPLKRKLVCFKRLVAKENLCGIKVETNSIEDRLKIGTARTVNIDPGYVTEAKLVLLTTKDYTHRVYIGKSVFAESTLFFRDNSFSSWPWTYPDYAGGEMKEYFNNVRELYMNDIKA